MTEQSARRVVRGFILLPTAIMPGIAAQVVVKVEDISRADAPAIVVGEQRLASVFLSSGGRVPFEIQVPAERIDERGSYSVSAHIDLGGSGQVEPGDYISTQTYPVLTGRYPDDVEVEVRPVSA
jgi:putative lipoprotein